MAAIHIWFPLQNVVATRGLVCYLGVFTDTCRAVERQLPSATMLNFASLSLSLICTLWLFLSVSLANVTQLRSQKPFPCGTWSDKFSEVLQAVIKDTKLVPRWLEVGCWIVRCCTKSRKKKKCCNNVLWHFNLLMRNLFIWYGAVRLFKIISAAHCILCFSHGSMRKYPSKF